MRRFGLIGKNLIHSYSATYFNNYFNLKNINAKYCNFELNDISEFDTLISKRNISGLNITIPYKEHIIKKLDDISHEAKMIGAVNTIQFKSNKIIGHNTDWIGFYKSIKPVLENRDKALLLGNGGAAKAIKYALKKLNIEYKIVCRNSSFNYSSITKNIISNYNIIINATPVGTFPKIHECPDIDYQYIGKKHLLFDVVYNPHESLFLHNGKKNNAKILNGEEMLKIQADEAWKIWNK